MARSIPDSAVQAVRDAIDLVDLVSDQTRLERRGKRLLGLCPFHKEKTPSFSVDAERGLYYCFGCGAGGDALKFHMLMTGDDFVGAIESLARRYGVALPERGAERDDGVGDVLEAAESFFRTHLERAETPRRYLEKRRVPAPTIDEFRIGFAPDSWRSLLEFCAGKFSNAQLEKAGLIARSERSGGRFYDRFRNRLMFPIRTPSGRLVGFGGRTLGDDRAKYLNTAETPSFRKGHILYALDRARPAIRETRRVILVEGYFDVLGVVLSGVDECVASMGTALTEAQVELLARYSEEVIIGYDGDRAGLEASRKALPMLLAKGLKVRRARFPSGQDPDALRLDEGAEAVVECLDRAPDAVTSEIERLPPQTARDPHALAAAARELSELLRPIPDRVLRFGYAQRAAEHLGIPVSLLRDAARPARRSQSPDQRESASADGEPSARSARQPRYSMEERSLQILLGSRPKLEDLPSSVVFWDPECRELYRLYREILPEVGPSDSIPDVLLERLNSVNGEQDAAGDGTIDRLAKLLLEEPSGVRPEELRANLRQLDRRAMRRRQEELKRELVQAEREGDRSRLQELLDEKAKLSRQIHGR